MYPQLLMLGYIREELVLDALEAERQMGAFALGEGFCLGRVYHDAATATGSLWVLGNELDRGDCRDLVVPSRMHLDAAPGPRWVVQRLWEMDPALRCWSLDRREGLAVLRRRERGGDHSHSAGVTELNCFRCPVTPAGRATAGLHVHESLTRAGLRDMVTAVDTVLGALVDEALLARRRRTSREYPIYTRTAAALQQLASEAFNELQVRLLVTRSDELVVEVVEPREHEKDLLPAALVPLGRGGRLRPREGGTLTWWALPLAAAWTEMADLVRAHHNVVAGGVL
ncbi:hypothetical protein [Nocardia sp. BMG51109]|uniref:hypothetical protein n=1 Tax=Nocardia sp. BMG51109 TaxID=1056816 RepID=UPI00046463F6|nr:hypothetical protein [Nocardia sp. BMG51109]